VFIRGESFSLNFAFFAVNYFIAALSRYGIRQLIGEILGIA